MDERMDAPNGKRIVELLRRAAMGVYEGAKGKVMDNIAQLIGCYGAMDYRTIDKLADMVEEAIQHEHESAYDAGYDEGFASADDWCAQHEDAMAEHGWVRLPKDGEAPCKHLGEWIEKRGLITGPLDHDGELWHKGDMSASPWGEIESIVFDGQCWQVCGHDTSAPWLPADSLLHYHAPTVEDMLQEFVNRWMKATCYQEPELIAEYAAKFRLAGDAQ